MKIEKVNDHQIRCTLTREDLADRELKLSELAYGTEKAKDLFRDMMQQASYEFGFEAEDIPLMIEAIPLNSECIVLIITKVEDPEELDTRFAKFAPPSEEDPQEEIPAPLLEGAAAPAAPAAASESKDIGADRLRIFSFRSLDAVTQASQVLGDTFDGHNSLYRSPLSGEYFLVISRQGYSEDDFARVLNTLSEFGSRVKGTYASEAYYQEHFELIIDGLALQILQNI